MKKNFVNLAILAIGYFAPLYIFHKFQSDIFIIESIQISVFVTLFIGSALLTYLNNKNRKQDKEHKWWWPMFMIIGILGLCYSGFVLGILFLFRHCCGF